MATAYTAEDLRSLAGAECFARGEEYLDAVADLRVRDGALHATVHDSEVHRVRLGFDGGLGGDCTCRHGAAGVFCTHLVAVGLAKLHGVGTGPFPAAAPEDEEEFAGEDDDEELREHLAELDHAELVDLLVDIAAADEHVAVSLWWRIDNPQ